MDYLVDSRGGYREFLGPHSAFLEAPSTGFFCGLWTETDTGDVYAYDNVNGWGAEPLFSLKAE